MAARFSAGMTLEEYYGEAEFEQKTAKDFARNVTRRLGFGEEVTDIDIEYTE